MTRICNHPGCPQHVEHGNRCPEHRTPDKRGSRGYSTTAWQRARTAYLGQHPYCEYIGIHHLHPSHREHRWPDMMRCADPATDVDHIDGLGPRGPRGTDPTNLRAYCHQHHSQRTARDHQPGSREARGVA